jgi:hypothetical protein
MAAEFETEVIAGRAVRKGDVIVRDVVEEVDLILLKSETGSNRMNRRIAPSLIKEPAVLIETLEEVEVCFRPQPVETTDLEVGPLEDVS